MPLIRQFSGTVFTEEFVEDLLQSFDPLLPAMRRLDNKDKTDQTPPTREDVVNLLKSVDENETLHECIMDGYNAAGALMMFCTHVLAIQTLMRNTEDYAEKTTRSASSQAFKNDPTPRGMRNYILDSITKRRRAVPRHISVWDEEDDQEEVPVRATASRRRSRPTTATRRPVTSAWQEEQNTRRTTRTRTTQSQSSTDRKRGRKTKRPSSSEEESETYEEQSQSQPRCKRSRMKSCKPSTSKHVSSESSESSSSEREPTKNSKSEKSKEKTPDRSSPKTIPRYKRSSKQDKASHQHLAKETSSSSTSSTSSEEDPPKTLRIKRKETKERKRTTKRAQLLQIGATSENQKQSTTSRETKEAI